MLPNRFAICAAGAAGVVLAFGLDRARSAVPGDQGGRNSGWRRWVPASVAVLVVLPLIPLPLQAAAVTPVPCRLHTAFARLRLAPDAAVLVVPVPFEEAPQALRWQAETGEPGSLIGGWFIGPDRTGHAQLYGTGQTNRPASTWTRC